MLFAARKIDMVAFRWQIGYTVILLFVMGFIIYSVRRWLRKEDSDYSAQDLLSHVEQIKDDELTEEESNRIRAHLQSEIVRESNRKNSG